MMVSRLFFVTFLLSLIWLITPQVARAQEPAVYQQQSATQDVYSCAYEISRAEIHYQIPRGLLYAIGVIESGRFGFPWPWTLNINGQGFYAQSFADAATQLYDQNGQAHQKMAVGCMQIYMRYHGQHFQSAADILDPVTNVWYAAGFLRQLYEEQGNWTMAVARYHAANPNAQQKYVCRVLNVYRQINELPPTDDPYCTRQTG